MEPGALAGRWIKRKADEHECRKPKLDYESRWGDIWQCDECLTQWIVKEDQRDGKWLEIHEA